MVARHRRDDLVQPGRSEDPLLLLPGNQDPFALAEHGLRTPNALWDVWRARCLVTGTPGSGSGPEKPTGGNTGRALRADFALTMATVELWKYDHSRRDGGQWKAWLSFSLGIELSYCARTWLPLLS